MFFVRVISFLFCISVTAQSANSGQVALNGSCQRILAGTDIGGFRKTILETAKIIFGEKGETQSIRLPADPHLIHGRTFLKLLSQDTASEGKTDEPLQIPREVIETLDIQREVETADTKALYQERAKLISALGSDYRPITYLLVLNVLEEFRQGTRVLLNRNAVFTPLTAVVRSSSASFLRVVGLSAAVDELQAQLAKEIASTVLLETQGETRLAILANRYPKLNAFKAVFISNFSPELLLISDRTLGGLKDLWPDLVTRLAIKQEALIEARKEYASQFYVASMSWNLLKVVACIQNRECPLPSEILRRAQVPNLEDANYIRELALAAVAESGDYIHAILGTTKAVEFSALSQSLGTQGSEDLDLVLVRQLDRGHRRYGEYRRALNAALRWEIDTLKPLVQEKKWRAFERRMTAAVKSSLQGSMNHAGERILPPQVLALLAEQIAMEDSETPEERKSLESLFDVPSDLQDYLNPTSVPFLRELAPDLPLAQETFKPTESRPSEKAPGKYKEEVPGIKPEPDPKTKPEAMPETEKEQSLLERLYRRTGPNGYTYFAAILKRMDSKLQAIFKEATQEQENLAKELKFSRNLSSDAVAQIQTALSGFRDVIHAFRASVISYGKTESQADWILAWHIYETSPALHFAIMNYSEDIAYIPLVSKLILHGLRVGFPTDYRSFPTESKTGIFPRIWQSILAHKIKFIAGALVTGAVVLGGTTYWLWPSGTPSVTEVHEVPKPLPVRQ